MKRSAVLAAGSARGSGSPTLTATARPIKTRVGEIELQIPNLRQGSYFPGFLEPRKASEQALVACVQEAYVNGVSTRKFDRLVEAFGLAGISKGSGLSPLPGPRRARRVPQPAPRGRLPVPLAGRQGRESARGRFPASHRSKRHPPLSERGLDGQAFDCGDEQRGRN